MKIEQIKNFLERNKDTFESLAALFTIFGIAFVGVQYHRQQEVNREQKAFELYQQFNEGNFITSRNALKEAYYKNREDNPDYADTIKNYVTTMQPLWKKEYVKIISIKDFFEQVVTCVDQKLCDEETTKALFGKEAQEFLEINHQFFCLERQEHGDKKIGIVLERFVENNKTNIKKNKTNNSQGSNSCDYMTDYKAIL